MVVTDDANKTAVHNLTTKLTGDNRMYLNLDVFGMKWTGMLDAGANRTVIGQQYWEMLQDMGITLQLSDLQSVSMADGNTHLQVLGRVDIPITVEGQTHVIPCEVVPSLCHTIILGIDFWRRFGIVPDARTNSFIFSSSPFISTLNDVPVSCEGKITDYDRLTSDQKSQLDRLLCQYKVTPAQSVGCTPLVEHYIDTGSARPIKHKAHIMSPAMESVLHKEVDYLIDHGIVRKSKSPWSSLPVLVDKGDGTKRLCINFKDLNKVTKKDAYPLPQVRDILDRLKNAQYLSTIDIKHAFWQVALEQSSIEKTAFAVAGRGLYEWVRMPMGLHNSPATWQRLIDSVLLGEEGEDLKPNVFCYLDDIVIINSDYDSHMVTLTKVMERIAKAGLTINFEKSKFCREQLKYLGYIIDKHGLRVDPCKIEAILNFPAPRKVRQLRRFLGMTSWYRRFVPNFAQIASPLNALTGKGVIFRWTPACERAFMDLKDRLCSAPILSCPDFSRMFTLQTDASGSGLGAVLTQQFPEGERVICYLSRGLTKAERNYSGTQLECLCVLWAVEKLRPYLEGYHFEIITDCFSLQWLENLKDPLGKLARWALRLQEYDYTLIHRKGSLNVVPDALSRALEGEDTVEAIPADQIGDLGAVEIDPVVQDKWYSRMLDKVTQHPGEHPRWRAVGTQLWRESTRCAGEEPGWKQVIPKERRREILHQCHDIPLSGHFGCYKTTKRVLEAYYWPKLKADVARYVRACDTCFRYKIPQQRPPGLMGAQRVVGDSWELISTDIMGPWPRTRKGHRYLLVTCDYFSKMVVLRAVRDATTEAVKRHLEEDVFLTYSVPKAIILDNGSQYTSREFRDFLEDYKVKPLYNAHYHPQANPTERTNRVVKSTIASYLPGDQKCWDKDLHFIACAIKTAYHEVLQETPFFMNFGHQMRLSGDQSKLQVENNEIPLIGPRDTRLSRLAVLRDIREKIRDRLLAAYKKNQRVYNLRRRDLQYQVGDLVGRKNMALSNKLANYNAGLGPKFLGPFRVKKREGAVTYVLETLDGKLAGRWHVQDLKPHV